MTPRFSLTTLSLLAAVTLPAAAQQAPTPEELAIRHASPGVIIDSEHGEYTAIELELQGCRIVQTLLTNQGFAEGGPVGVQVLRMDLRDLDPLTGIMPAEDTTDGHRRVMLMPSQSAWEEIQAAGGVFSEMRRAASEQGDQEDVNGPNGARTLRTRAQHMFSADAQLGAFGPVMARTHVMQMRGDRGALIYPLVAPMQLTLDVDHAEAALEVINALRAGPCAPQDGIAADPAPESGEAGGIAQE
jgi:hypothetical protein